jgi:hypothetical protein
MKRKQIYIAPEQEEQLRRLSEARHVPLSALIREAVAEYLVEQETPHPERPEDHPLWGIVGLVDDPDAPTDASINHDHYLYGAAKRRK